MGGVVFDTIRSDSGASTLDLTLPADGTPVNFWVAGEFQKPSLNYGDAGIEIIERNSGAPIGMVSTMVRVRKDARALSTQERDRFLNALGTLNAQGRGVYQTFRDMHTQPSTAEMHGDVGFLPWHRAFVLDFERTLQAIDESVAVPYWRFDQPAPTVFTLDFMGLPSGSNIVKFRSGHPLQTWVTNGHPGIVRDPLFAVGKAPTLLNEAQTFALEGGARSYGNFARMEVHPHGDAHTSFSNVISPISFVPTAVRDPLFFMLHANVDRLWAKWQWLRHRADVADRAAFAPSRSNRVGHRLGDTMWPWNRVVTPPRPSTAPGGRFSASGLTPAPGPTPTVGSMLDYLAVMGGDQLGFAYDEVPFEIPPVAATGASAT